jgi:hypothetical protein
MLPVAVPDRRTSPSGSKARLVTGLFCPLNVRWFFGCCRSHEVTEPSGCPENRVELLGAKASGTELSSRPLNSPSLPA